MSDLTNKNTSKWYSSLKRMTAYDHQKKDTVIIQDINHLTDDEPTQSLADNFSSIPNEYDQLKSEDIDISPFKTEDIPKF